MKRDQHGFTLVEITAVLVLMAIISAYVIGRSIGTEQIDMSGQTDKIRTQIRYAQAMGMKRSDADEIWGIKCDTNTDQYWLFSVQIPVTANDEDQAIHQIIFPGERNKKISLSDLIDDITGFTFFFDRTGKPYTAFVNETGSPLNNISEITLTAGGQTRKIYVHPETGLVQ